MSKYWVPFTHYLVRVCILNANIFWTSYVYAEAIDDEAVSPGDDVIVSLRKGAPAPFDGQLFDTATAIRWGVLLEQCHARAELALKKSEDVCKVELDFRDQLLKIQVEKTATTEKNLTALLKASEQKRLQLEHDRANPAWHASPIFYFVLGAVTVGGFGLLAAQAF